MMNCLNCNADIPESKTKPRKFCDNNGKCKTQFNRRSKRLLAELGADDVIAEVHRAIHAHVMNDAVTLCHSLSTLAAHPLVRHSSPCETAGTTPDILSSVQTLTSDVLAYAAGEGGGNQ
jgi:hypothetical protein